VREHYRDPELQALNRGFSKAIIVTTRSFQHLTVYAKLILILYLLTEIQALGPVAHFLEIFVFVCYHSIVTYDPKLLTHDITVSKKVTGFWPPMDKHIFPWIGLHIQHTLCPLHAMLMPGVVYDQTGILSLFVASVGYVCWNYYCWYVQGIPVYPFQMILRTHGLEIPLLVLNFSAMFFFAFFLT
jgi:hypothetical protein